MFFPDQRLRSFCSAVYYFNGAISTLLFGLVIYAMYSVKALVMKKYRKVQLMIAISGERYTSSQRTHQMQRHLLHVLALQALFTALCIVVPMTLLTYSFAGMSFIPDFIGGVGPILISSHSAVNSLILLTTIKVYRRQVILLVKRIFEGNKRTQGLQKLFRRILILQSGSAAILIIVPYSIMIMSNIGIPFPDIIGALSPTTTGFNSLVNSLIVMVAFRHHRIRDGKKSLTPLYGDTEDRVKMRALTVKSAEVTTAQKSGSV
ncbi:unnamed protein product, partial [Mesorhabditis spiculigera]